MYHPAMSEQTTITDQQPSEIHAKIMGEVLTELPEDLYIPPEALRVFLEAFEGPLDLLLYLIKKSNLDILDIPIAEITRQYMHYVDIMSELQLELAAEYLVMAAMLAEIKSRLLLPRPVNEDEGEFEDPRAELIRRLQDYERYKIASLEIEERPRMERDNFIADSAPPPLDLMAVQPDVTIEEMMNAFREVMQRAKLFTDHFIEREVLSIRERMTIVLNRVNADEFTTFTQLFTPEEGRMGVVVTFIAILELTRQHMLEIVQAEVFAPIYVKAKGESNDE